MDYQNLGQQIRHFVRELFGSRLTAHMEEELMRLRADCETRIMERERIISDLREEKVQLMAKVDRYELVLLPLASPLGGFFAPKKERPPLAPVEPTVKSWPEIQADWEKLQAEEEERDKAKPV